MISKLGMKHKGEGEELYKVCINRDPVISRIRRPMTLKLGMKYQEMQLYKVYINHDPEMTLACFPARST